MQLCLIPYLGTGLIEACEGLTQAIIIGGVGVDDGRESSMVLFRMTSVVIKESRELSKSSPFVENMGRLSLKRFNFLLIYMVNELIYRRTLLEF
jgi:hypothetical protein